MDNLKYYNDSLAYDYEMFMPKTAEKVNKDNIVKLPQSNPCNKERRKAAVRSISVSAFAIMASVFMLAAMLFFYGKNPHCRITIHVLQLNKEKAETSILC